jgi:hypothetical protein
MHVACRGQRIQAPESTCVRITSSVKHSSNQMQHGAVTNMACAALSCQAGLLPVHMMPCAALVSLSDNMQNKEPRFAFDCVWHNDGTVRKSSWSQLFN